LGRKNDQNVRRKENEMKTINVTFTDHEFRRLIKAKQKKEIKRSYSWHEFILNKCCLGIK
jgi:hypothetical protein